MGRTDGVLGDLYGSSQVQPEQVPVPDFGPVKFQVCFAAENEPDLNVSTKRFTADLKGAARSEKRDSFLFKV